jgi:hypothetical protein
MEILAVIKNAFLKYKFPLPKDQKWLESRSDIKFSMSIDQYVENSEGLIGKGRLILEFLNSKSNDVKKLSLSGELGQAISSEQQNLNMALIRLPELFIQEVFLKAYEENTWLHRVSSKKISGLNSLMNSRFMQFFNWRELMKYPKSSEFYLDLYSNQNPFIKGQGLQFQVQEDLLTKMYAPRAGAYIPFMNFETPLSMNINIAAQQGFLLVHFKKPIMKFKYSWDINYLKKYRPSTYFNSEVMKESIVNSLSSTNYKFRLPTIPLMEGTFLKVHKIEAPNRKDIFLNLAP